MIKATITDDKISITENGKEFHLIPYIITPDGPQQLFGIEPTLERIVLCINDLARIPTETIRQGFTDRMMTTVAKANQVVDTTKKVLEATYAKEVKDQVEKQKASDISSIPAEAP